MAYLERVNSPDDLKKLDIKELQKLAKEIRAFLIDSVSKTGGHLASSLGVVEASIALHYVFDFKKDRIIWDVGHQAYVHKILTGRKDRFHTLRKFNGLSGFPKITESEYDHFNTGHSSTSISAALGMAIARDLKGEDYQVIAFIGDGSLTAGLAFEGMNQAGHLKKKMMVILNDNDMSIAPNVGALNGYLNQILSGQFYKRTRDRIETILKSMGSLGTPMIKMAKGMEETIKRLFVPGMLFEELGFKYVGPVDGHDIEKLIEVFRKYRDYQDPVLIHIKTRKGKGYRFAEKMPEKWHGISPFDKDTGEVFKSLNNIPSYTEVFGKTIVELGERDTEIIAITAAMPSGTGLSEFGKRFPERFFDVGIAEQHAVTMAGGLAIQGKKPFVAIYSTFLQRAYDQVIHDVCLMNLPVVFCMDRGGIVGADGETHHGLYDIAYLRPVPNLVMMAPSDENELRHMLYTASKLSFPCSIRYPRGRAEGVEIDKGFKEIKIGKSRVLKEGDDAVIIAIGSMVWKAKRVADKLEQEGVFVKVIDARFIKPLDEGEILSSAEECGVVITVEEGVLNGGFGSAVVELLQDNNILVPVLRLGIPDRIVHQGSPEELLDELKLTETHIYYRVREFVKKYRYAKKRGKGEIE